ncbi:MAG: NAD(P)/FAD-dependent oxidoreductase [Gemmatimonadales bacterium]|nr:MAG: NAD(P)/FAD-dependent oxidoreductase [Gemmatimonadales bacterium]
MTIRDVIIVGAGPAGSFAAYRLAAMGYDVLVLEEHERVGEPVNCSGLIGAEAFERYDLPRRSVLRGFDRARFISPGGYEAIVAAGRTVAYVVDRGDFDRSLAEQAQEAGATYRLGTRCVGIRPGEDGVEVSVRTAGGDGRETLKARAVVLGTGVRYGLLKAKGWSRPGAFLNTAQAEVAMRGVEEVEVYLGREVSPGSFAWAIPLGPDRVKLGVCNHGRALGYMERLLSHPRVAGRLANGSPEIKTKPIPISPAARTYFERTLLVGDVAGQVKPTTAGGIYYGIVCADAAARALDGAFKRGELGERALRTYERLWRKEIGRELLVGRYFRRLGGALSDRQIDRLIRAYREPEFRDLVRRTADFERHSRFILALLASPIFWAGLLDPIRSSLKLQLP